MGSGGKRYSRRAVLAGSGAAAAAYWSPFRWSAERAAALDLALRTAASPDGTTLVASLVRAAPTGYARLIEGPGWPTLPREDLATLTLARIAQRVPLATVVHLTDVHVIDAQSPGRVEYLDDVNRAFSAAFRPQELLTTQVQSSMVRRIRDLRVGPICGRRFDCAVSTGDNIDNQQHNELDWFMGVLDGGTVSPNSGDRRDHEGVQSTDWSDPRFWHPEIADADRYATEQGFPVIDGFLAAAIADVDSPGLDIPWYSTYGNHDGLLQGNLPRTDAIDAVLMGDMKITGTASSNVLGLIGIFAGDTASVPDRVRRGELDARTVTPDERRRTITRQEWVQAHLDSTEGPGPVGHGYDVSHLERDALHYRFTIAPGVVGISLDTGGFNSGSIGESQLRWLEEELRSVSSRWFDTDGSEVRTRAADQLVLVFSHFTEGTMRGSTDPTRPTERRVQGPELTATLLRFPNVVAWVNGHTHTNSIRPVPDPAGHGGFWEITTASHVDFPEQARIIEVVDNDDGTLSLITTMIEHAAPATADYGDLSALGLASISRELSANDSIDEITRHVGDARSINCELALTAPFPLRTLHAATERQDERIAAAPPVNPEPVDDMASAPNPTADDVDPYYALAGGLGIGAALVAGAAVLGRRRDQVAAESPSGTSRS